MTANVANAIGLFWAGLCFSGSFLCAPAKFSVDSVAHEGLLEIGRAQFRWVGFAEFAMAMVVAVILTIDGPDLALIAVIFLFANQRLVFIPAIRRSPLGTQRTSKSTRHWHMAFVTSEVAKIFLLLTPLAAAFSLFGIFR